MILFQVNKDIKTYLVQSYQTEKICGTRLSKVSLGLVLMNNQSKIFNHPIHRQSTDLQQILGLCTQQASINSYVDLKRKKKL